MKLFIDFTKDTNDHLSIIDNSASRNADYLIELLSKLGRFELQKINRLSIIQEENEIIPETLPDKILRKTTLTKWQVDIILELFNSAEVSSRDIFDDETFYDYLNNGNNRIALISCYISARLKKIVKSRSNVRIFLVNRFCSAPAVEITDLNGYFEIEEQVRKISYFQNSFSSIADDYLYYALSQERKKLTNLSPHSASNYLESFVYNEIKKFKASPIKKILIEADDDYMVDLFLSNITTIPANYWYKSDVSTGFPNLISGKEILIFKNISSLNFEEQQRLREIIKSFNYSDKFIVLQDKKINLFQDLQNEFVTTYRLPSFRDFATKLSRIFFLFACEGKKDGKISSHISTLLDGNAFYSLITRSARAFYEIKSAVADLGIIDYSSFIFDADFWYSFEKYILKQREQVSTEVTSTEKSKSYFMNFRGDYWEISFGYEKPILLENSEGIFYLAHILSEKGNSIPSYLLRKRTHSTPDKIDKGGKHINSIRSAVKQILPKIESYESLLSLGNELSNLINSEILFSDKNEEVSLKKESIVRIEPFNISVPQRYRKRKNTLPKSSSKTIKQTAPKNKR